MRAVFFSKIIRFLTWKKQIIISEKCSQNWEKISIFQKNQKKLKLHESVRKFILKCI